MWQNRKPKVENFRQARILPNPLLAAVIIFQMKALD